MTGVEEPWMVWKEGRFLPELNSEDRAFFDFSFSDDLREEEVKDIWRTPCPVLLLLSSSSSPWPSLSLPFLLKDDLSLALES